MTGFEAAVNLSMKSPHCKILLFSGQAATANLLNEAQGNGRKFEILAKPVHPKDLIEKMRVYFPAPD
jgi:hypothetical protein